MTQSEVERRWRGWPWIILAAAVIAIVIALNSPLFAVDHVEILGAERADVAAAVDRAGVGPGALVLWVDTGSIATEVAADPWVQDVRVERVFPNRVVVEVLERRPVVWIEGISSWMLVSSDGTVIETADGPGAGLLRARVAFPDRRPGDRPVDPAWDEVVQMALVLAEDIGGTMTLDMRGAEMWTEALGHEVRLGNPIDLADKARTLRAILAGGVADGAIVDVSSPQRPAVVPPEPQE